MSVRKAASRAHMHALYRDHHGWLQRWLRSRLACSHQAAELAHDTFVRVLAAPDDASAPEIREPRRFLAAIANRVLVDWIRRRSIERAYLETLAMQPEPCDPSPETREVIIETLVEIERLLDSLGERPRQIFLMTQVDGLSYVDIGRRRGLSVTTVRKHFTRAISACLELIED